MKIWNLPEILFLPFNEIVETRPIALITTSGAWEAVASRLAHLKFDWQATINEAAEEQWSAAAEDLSKELGGGRDLYKLYAVGGGLAVDAAKYIAAQLDMELFSLPTALSVDAFLTWASGVRSGGCVKYLETKPPDQLVVDFEVLAAAPSYLRAAGICDVLSIATGLWDWRFAETQEKNPPGMAFIPWVAEAAEAILQGSLDCAAAAGAGEPSGLKQLLDCLAMEVQLCNQIGHSRPEEGSEHYFAYSVENIMGKGLPHGDLVGPGILEMARLQGQDTTRLKQALDACRIPLSNIPPEVVEKTLADLPDYVREHNLPFGIAHILGEGGAFSQGLDGV